MRMMFAKVGTEAWEPCLNPIRYRNNITTYITELTGRTEKEVLPKNKFCSGTCKAFA